MATFLFEINIIKVQLLEEPQNYSRVLLIFIIVNIYNFILYGELFVPSPAFVVSIWMFEFNVIIGLKEHL